MTPSLLSISEARERVLEVVRRLSVERVDVEQAIDRVLAEEVFAAGDVPPFPCSAMDGYAVIAGDADRRLTVAGESRAGRPADATLQPGEAFRISTGAAVPPGADAVIRQEDVVVENAGGNGEQSVVIPQTAVPVGNNIRQAGEDMRAGALVLGAGTVLRAGELGAAVAAGVGSLTVSRRPRVAILCTGDELRAPGEALGPGEIHNSNAPMLRALALRAGADAAPAVRLPDDLAATKSALSAALEQSDLLVISGGVSVGPHDHVKPALEALGVAERFWGVALQPGKPTWFGTIDDRIVFGLPGNPVSAVVTFTLFARPALLALQGAAQDKPPTPLARLGEPVRRNPSREQAIRVRLQQRDLTTVAVPNGPQDSHILSSLLGADALAIIPRGPGILDAGSEVALEAFRT